MNPLPGVSPELLPGRRSFLGTLCAAACGTALPAFPALAASAAGYPDRPVRVIVPFPAGSGTDNTARYVTQGVSALAGQTMPIDNRAGASGFIAARAVAAAAADGYTLLLTTNTTHAANASLFKKLPYDPVKDFTPVSLIAKSGLVLLVPADSPVRSVAELTALAKTGKRRLSFGSGSSSTRIASELYRIMSGVDALHVPYKGVPQALTDLMGRQVDFMMADISPAAPLVRSGRLRALAVTTSRRDPLFKEVPTMEESGLAGYELSAWVAAFFPAGTPQPVVEKMNQWLRQALGSPAAVEHLAGLGLQPAPSTPQELAAFVDSETLKWARVIQAAGIEPE